MYRCFFLISGYRRLEVRFSLRRTYESLWVCQIVSICVIEVCYTLASEFKMLLLVFPNRNMCGSVYKEVSTPTWLLWIIERPTCGQAYPQPAGLDKTGVLT